MMFVFVSLLLCINGVLTSGLKQDANMTITSFCDDKERQALLYFKANLSDINNSLHDWGNKEKDCCQWVGVTCNKQDGYVTRLDLSAASNGLSGNISHLLPLLSHLRYLDLSGIDFQLNSIPNSLCSLTNLQYLNLSVTNIGGSIPHQLSNLSNLLQLDLSSNLLSGSIPVSFETLTSLTHLDLSGNRLEGVIPNIFGNWSSLVHLDLSKNHLNGSVPNFDGCPSLQKLDLSRNGLTGNLPKSVGELSNLNYLVVSSNYLDGLISDVHLLNLTQLTYLDLSSNSFTINFSSHARFRFNLTTIKLQSCKLGPSFPVWIQTQKHFAYLDISNAGISDRVPGWFWDLPSGLKFLNLSSNEIKGMLPNVTSVFERYPGLDLSYNQLEGTIPVLPSKLAALNLSGNKFSGTLSFLCQIDIVLTLLDLSNNLISGSLPDCLQKFQEKLVVLNLSNNNLSGEIPSSLGSLTQLQALYLRRNAFVGKVPMSLSNCTKLRFLDLGENKLSGNIPAWIGETLSELSVLVLRSNRLEGSVPPKMCLLNKLQVLDLSNNGLSGNIPRCLDNLTAMATKGFQDDIMGHSYSSYVSHLPGKRQGRGLTSQPYHLTYDALLFNNTKTSRRACSTYYRCTETSGSGLYCLGPDGGSISCGPDEDALFFDNTLVMWKGTQREFGRGLYLLKIIDISSNRLYGKLPDEITNLLDLVSLNLSINKLHGEVPKDMGKLKNLESLDLSRNEFFGNIPLSLSYITSLSYLNLSCNNLSGRIPPGPQLQSFSSSSFTGNPQLCGPPLTPRCGLPPPSATIVGKEDVEEDGDEFWNTGMGAGFVVGYLGICGALFLNRRCRYLFFASLNNMKDWIFVTTVVHFQNLHTKFKRF